MAEPRAAPAAHDEGPGGGRGAIAAWALYDAANSAFATTVMAGFFPVFLKAYWASGEAATSSSLKLGLTNAGASVIVALTGPVLGALADQRGRRKPFLTAFAAAGAMSAAALAVVPAGHPLWACGVYGLGLVGFAGANVFYDALLLDVARQEKAEQISALGYGVGYLGGGLLFAVNVAMARSPSSFGLTDEAAAIRASFVVVGVWWGLLTVPLLLAVRERPAAAGGGASLADALARLKRTAAEARASGPLWRFLLAYLLYIDGVDTVVLMAVDYGLSLGLGPSALLKALLLTQAVGFPAALAMGKLGEVIGARRAVLLGLLVYAAIATYASQISSEREFYGLAVAVGLVQGGVQANSRALFAKLVPRDRAAELFGLYNVLGKFATILGPVLVGGVAALTGSHRAAIVSVVVLFGAGALLLRRVPEPDEAPG